MSGTWQCARRLWFAGALAVLFANAGKSETPIGHVQPDAESLLKLAKVKMSPPPAWPENRRTADWTVDDIKAEFGRATDRTPNINYCRTTFVRPDHSWLVNYKNWFVKLQKTLQLKYEDEVWDCDNFARSFVAFADLLALRGGEARGSICIGWATVHNVHPFGGIRGNASGAHAIVVVGTSKGIFVLEPQSGEMAALQDYPNRDEFEDVNL